MTPRDRILLAVNDPQVSDDWSDPQNWDGGVWLTVLAVEGEDVVFGLCPPEGTEVVCEPPEPTFAAVPAGEGRGVCPPEDYLSDK